MKLISVDSIALKVSNGKLEKICFSQTLQLNLQLDPEQIKDLADKIDATVSQLENVDAIIQDTRADLALVSKLKEDSSNTRYESV